MYKKIVYGKEKLVATILAVMFIFSTFGLIGFSANILPVYAQNEMKSLVQGNIKNATYYTIENATTPAVTIDPKTGTLYAVYFREENGGGNMYLQRSDDMGKTFSGPGRINNI
jgi:hypothetical protein